MLFIWTNAQHVADWLCRVKAPVSFLYQGQGWSAPSRETAKPYTHVGMEWTRAEDYRS